VATATLTVVPVDRPPVVADDTFSTNEGSPLIVGAPGVLLNSIDYSSNPLSAVTKTGPSHGVLALASNGAFVYEPYPGFSGVDSFTFQATDGTLASNVGTITIDVVPVVLPPVALPQSYATQEDQRLYVVAPGVLANDTDPQGLPLTASVFTLPQNGTIILNTAGGVV
jgi:hypothetical protein